MLKKFLLHFIVSILFVICDTLIIRKVKLSLREMLVLSIVPGMIISTLLIYFIKKVIEDIKRKDYLVVIFTIAVGAIFTKYYFKL